MTTESKPLICVFAASAMPTDRKVVLAAHMLGQAIGSEGCDLITGGTVGLMGVVARAAKITGANVTAVYEQKYAGEEVMEGVRAVYVPDVDARFSVMTAVDGIVAAPGSTGTLEEAIRSMNRAVYSGGPPVALVRGKYLRGLAEVFDLAIDAGMAKPESRDALRMWIPGDSIRKCLKL